MNLRNSRYERQGNKLILEFDDGNICEITDPELWTLKEIFRSLIIEEDMSNRMCGVSKDWTPNRIEVGQNGV